MSTRIDNAYIINTDIHTFLNELVEFKHRWAAEQNLLIASYLIKSQFENMLMHPNIDYNYDDILKNLKKNYKENINEYKLATPMDCEFYFLESSLILYNYENNYYVITLGYNPFHKFFYDYFKDTIHDFSYQNQTDIPHGITKKEYELRNLTWNKIFEKHSTFGSAGNVFRFDDFNFYEVRNVIRSILSKDDMNKLYEEICYQISVDKTLDKSKKIYTSARLFNEWKRAHKEEIEICKNELLNLHFDELFYNYSRKKKED